LAQVFQADASGVDPVLSLKSLWTKTLYFGTKRIGFLNLTHGLLLLRGHQTSLRGLEDVGVHTAYGTTKLPQELRTLASIRRLSGSKKQRTNIAQSTKSGLTNVSLRYTIALVNVLRISVHATARKEVAYASSKVAKATKNTVNHR
jgi:hypothetical protein